MATKTMPKGGRKKKAMVVDTNKPGASVTTIIENIIASKHSAIDVVELGREFMEQMGGIPGLVRELIKDHKNAIPGTPERARFLSIMIQIIQMAATQSQPAEFSEMSDEEIEAYAKTLMTKVGVQGVGSQGWIDHVCI